MSNSTIVFILSLLLVLCGLSFGKLVRSFGFGQLLHLVINNNNNNNNNHFDGDSTGSSKFDSIDRPNADSISIAAEGSRSNNSYSERVANTTDVNTNATTVKFDEHSLSSNLTAVSSIPKTSTPVTNFPPPSYHQPVGETNEEADSAHEYSVEEIAMEENRSSITISTTNNSSGLTSNDIGPSKLPVEGNTAPHTPSSSDKGTSNTTTAVATAATSSSVAASSTSDSTRIGTADDAAGSLRPEVAFPPQQPLQQDQVNYYSSISPAAHALMDKYKGKFVCISAPQYPHCEIYLCGTLHVAHSSVSMVKEAIRGLKPNYVVLELCEGRIDNLEDYEDAAAANLTMIEVVRGSIEQRSFKSFGMGLLTWMQLKAAKLMGSRLGGEQSVASKEAYLQGATVVLGDRLYGVTLQRIFDHLNAWEKLKMIFVILWEVLTMSLFKVKEYIRKTENEESFIRDEITRFSKHMPAFANVIISERDEYLTQTICEIARVGFGKLPPPGVTYFRKGKILAVVGAGHLEGIQRHLIGSAATGITEERLLEISSSSKHNATWPGKGMLHVIDPAALYAPKTKDNSVLTKQ